MDAAVLRSIKVTVTLIALDWYLKTVDNGLVARFARLIDNRRAKENPINLEFADGWAKMTEFKDKDEFIKFFTGNWNFKADKFDVAVEWSRLDLEKANALFKVTDFSRIMGIAAALKPIELVTDTLLANGTAYDDKALFATDHPHPGDTAKTYSNLVAFETAGSAFAQADARFLLTDARAIFMDTLGFRRRMIEADEINSQLTVVTYDTAVFKAFDEVKKKRSFAGQDENEWFNGFSLYRDSDPDSLMGDDVHILNSEEGGLRPVIYAVTTEPNRVFLDTTKMISDDLITAKMIAELKAVPGFPQAAIQYTVTNP